MARKATAPETKTCTKCGEEHEVEELHKDKFQKDGLSSWCKECTRSYDAAYRASLKAAKATKNAAIKTPRNSKAFEAGMQAERVERKSKRAPATATQATTRANARTNARRGKEAKAS